MRVANARGGRERGQGADGAVIYAAFAMHEVGMARPRFRAWSMLRAPVVIPALAAAAFGVHEARTPRPR